MNATAIFSRELLTAEAKAAINVVAETLLLDGMKRGIVEFEFTKRDGSTRHAFGTRLPRLMKEHVEGGMGPNKDSNGQPNGLICFWDVEKAAWRSVWPSQVTKIW